MSLAALIFSGWNWLWPALALSGLTLVFLFWSYRGAGGAVRWVCLGLKMLGVGALAFCLLEPLWSGQRARPGSNLFAIIADNSQGMQIKDRGQTRSRGDLLRESLVSQHTPWQESLDQNFEVRRYFFDTRLQATKYFS